jgi:outer membrane protein assembly factor BamB
MRLASAFVVSALALTTAACRSSVAGRPTGDKELAAKLRDLGVEGKTYANDLGAVSSIRLGNVYVAGPDLLVEDIHGHLTYLDGATLNPRWEYYGLPKGFDKTPDFTPSAVIGIAGGKVFVISRDNGTTEIEPRRIDIVPSGAPVATDATIYVPTYPTPSSNKTIQSSSLATGFMGWGWRTTADIVGAMAKSGPGAGDEFYFATTDGQLFAFPTYPATAASTDLGWSTDLHGAVTSDLAIEGADLGVVMTDGRLVCVDRVTGGVRWEAYAGSRERADGPAMFSAKLLMYRCGGELRAFARDTGAKAWAVKGATGFVAERGGRILLTGSGDRLISIDKRTGEVLGQADARGWTFPPRVVPDSTVYAISSYGAVMSVEVGF